MVYFTSFYRAKPTNKYWMLLATWLFWPGGMFVVAAICESRLVPVFTHQPLAFIPGDLFLGVMLVALIGIEAHTKKPEINDFLVWHWVLLIGTMAILVGMLRQGERWNYQYSAFISPTKMLHDVVGYFILPTLIIGIGLPLIILIIRGAVEFDDESAVALAIFAAAFCMFVICVVLDWQRGFSLEDIAARHPSMWRPIWVH